MERVPIAAISETAKPLKTVKEIPADDFYLTTSCILGVINPATEVLITRIYDLLGLHWGLASARPASQCTCCSGIATHGDVMAFESTLLVVARIWSLAAELGFENITTACVTSFAIHSECLEMYHAEAGLEEKVDRWLYEACGRRLQIPKHVVHASDIIYRYRDTLADSLLKYRLVDHRTGRPLRIVDHVGCHYNKVFPERAVGGADYCDVLTGMIRSWGGQTVDYPERRHCCGMGFRQCMIRPNRGYTMACVLKKLDEHGTVSAGPHPHKLSGLQCVSRQGTVGDQKIDRQGVRDPHAFLHRVGRAAPGLGPLRHGRHPRTYGARGAVLGQDRHPL